MGNYLNPDNSKFQEALNSDIYVDKTGLIRYTNSVLHTLQKNICVSRPRRFGKSVTANMLAAYYSRGCQSEKLFDGLKIKEDSSFSKYLNKYNVFFINMQEFLSRSKTVEKMVLRLNRILMRDLKQEYPDVDYFDEEDLAESMQDVYQQTGCPFVIIIDEWDCIFREYKSDKEAQEQYLDFLRDFLKDKSYIHLAYMTGILPVKKYGTHFIHAGDEWYILAGYELPEEGRYDGYLQLENGVGMMRLLETEVKERLEQLEGDDREVNATVATGRLAAPYIGKMIKLVQKKFPNVQAEVYAVKNNFFGEKITVSGLITATDLMDQLAQRNLGEKVLIPCNMLRSGEDVFLDDLTVEDVRQALKTEVVVVDEPGADLVNCLIEAPDHKKIRRRQIYEQTGSSDSGQA